VAGGTAGALLMNFPLSGLRRMNASFLKFMFHREQGLSETIQFMVEISERVRREGILAIEQTLQEMNDEFLANGLRLAVDGTDPDMIKAILEIEIRTLEERHQVAAHLWSQVGTYAPAFGMIGTLIGLIQMLQSLDDPSKIGLGMATALVTTFYGAIIANLIALPIAGKLTLRSREELGRKALIMEGILSIQNGDNPRMVREKLRTFLPPHHRLLVQDD
jgi:chemotaxis protein MotA